ncbi:hypothetical protein ELQ92_02790 [Labedella populi]|uniref:DUF4237 domain-containing protein n=1 Tax=Labedella populi TaxID=2498850 RepID=A0A444QF84_9MICO|nr:hypothetical protein [Labedella populi]RWZ68180.1 hypothetical protein ELQ92_02790 [Labedella populi]
MPERPGPWDLLGKPSDPVVADTAAIDEQLAHFRSLAETLRVQGDRLARIGSGESLRGAYADELRSSASEVGKDLKQTVGRYEAVVSALQEYRPAIDAALLGSASALDDAIDAAGAQARADTMPLAEAAEGATLTPEEEQANADRTAAADGAAARLQEARARLTGVLQRLDEAGRTAARTVSRGFDDGLKDSHWDRFAHRFIKILKILITVFTIVATVLAVVALVIPGVGPVISAGLMAFSRGLDAVVVVSELVLVAVGESSPEDIAFAVLGLATLGVGSVAKGTRTAVPARGTPTETPAGTRPPTPRPDTPTPRPDTPTADTPTADTPAPEAPTPRPDAPPAARPDTPAGPTKTELDWHVPPGSKVVDPPNDLPPGVTIKPGTQTWESPTGVRYTRISHFEGYRGMGTDGARMFYDNGARRGDDALYQNGSPWMDWKGLYVADTKASAENWAHQVDDATGRPRPGDVVKFTYPHEFTLVTPNRELDKNPLESFPGLTGEPPHFVDRLGANGMIIRNPLFSDDSDRYEWVVPWSMAENGQVTPVARYIAGRSDHTRKDLDLAGNEVDPS